MSGPLLHRITALMQRRAPRDRREVRRVAPAHRTLCTFQRRGTSSSVTAAVHNLSPKGLGLLSPVECPTGTVLSLLLVNASSTFALAIEMTVVRCFRAAGDRYFLGGPFARILRHDEIIPFLI
jgi:hypothetical protein